MSQAHQQLRTLPLQPLRCRNAARSFVIAATRIVVAVGACTMAQRGHSVALAQTPVQTPAQTPVQTPVQSPVGTSGLPVPRFVSLKADRVNLRSGPSTDYPTSWIFRRAGLPLEVLREVEAWRQVRDAEGTTGWVLQTMLSGRRTVLVLPWDMKAGEQPPEIALRSSDSEQAAAIAKVEAGVIASVRTCDKRWCQITVGDFKGYIEQKKLWGVYDGEVVK
jgi:SH3-like domain-containing protein